MLPHWLRPARRPARTPAQQPLAPRWRPGVVQLEDRLAPASRLLGGLPFDAPAFLDGATQVSATGPARVGNDPEAGIFQPPLGLTDGVRFATADVAGAFTAGGAATAGGQSQRMLAAGESHTL